MHQKNIRRNQMGDCEQNDKTENGNKGLIKKNGNYQMASNEKK